MNCMFPEDEELQAFLEEAKSRGYAPPLPLPPRTRYEMTGIPESLRLGLANLGVAVFELHHRTGDA